MMRRFGGQKWTHVGQWLYTMNSAFVFPLNSDGEIEISQ